MPEMDQPQKCTMRFHHLAPLCRQIAQKRPTCQTGSHVSTNGFWIAYSFHSNAEMLAEYQLLQIRY